MVPLAVHFFLIVVHGAIGCSFFLLVSVFLRFGIFRILGAVSFSLELLLGSFSVALILLVLSFIFLGSLFSEEVSVSGDNTDEVGEEGDDDDSGQELSEDVVLLLELKVARFGGSPAVVDVFLLVDPHKVDDGPGGNE